MKLFFLLILLLTPLTLKAQFPDFTPFVLTNGHLEYLAFPGEQGKSVLYWIGVAEAYKAKSDTRGLEIKNVESQTELKIQYVTNNIELKKEKIEGRIIGAVLGTLVFGIASGLALSDIRSPNSGIFLGLGAGLGGGIFAVGLVIDLGENLKLRIKVL